MNRRVELAAAFKESSLGPVPVNWYVRDLGSLVDRERGIRYGIVQPGKFDPSGRLLIRGQDYSRGWVDASEMFRVGDDVERRYKNARVIAGDLIITIVGASTGEVAKVPAWLDGANLTQTTARIAVDTRNVQPDFVYHMLRSQVGASNVTSYVKGGAQPGLNCGDVEQFLIPIPESRAEQEAIAEALSDADALIEGLERLIAKKRLIKQGAMQDLLTAKRRLPGFSGEWRRYKLSELGEIAGSGIDKKFSENEQPVLLLNYTDVYRKSYITGNILSHRVTAPEAKARRCQIRKGDVFFTPTSETPDDIARCAVAIRDIPDAGYSYHVVRLRLNEADSSDFWAHIFETEDFRRQARLNAAGSGTRYVITLPKFRNTEVSIPGRPEREAVGAVLRDMHDEIEVLRTRLDKARQVKEGMMQNLLTGRIRLV